MALKTYATQAEVPEALRSEYIESNGKWIPNVEGAEELYAAGLKKSQKELLDDLKKAQAKLKAYDGVDPEEHKKLKDAAEKAAADAAKATGNWEQRETQLKEQHAKEAATMKAAIEKRDAAIRRQLVENKVREALGPLLLQADTVDVLLPHVERFIQVKEDGDNWIATVVDDKGQARIKDAQGTAFGIADLAKEMSEQTKYAPFFKGTGASGSGAKGSGTQQGGKKVIGANDDAAFLANLAGIAKGDVVVAGT